MVPRRSSVEQSPGILIKAVSTRYRDGGQTRIIHFSEVLDLKDGHETSLRLQNCTSNLEGTPVENDVPGVVALSFRCSTHSRSPI